MSYRSVVVTRCGPPEVMAIRENVRRAPAAGEVRVRILATCVTRPDVQGRYGESPFPPKPPYVPGYAIIGDIDALGKGVDGYAVGDRVAALNVYGGYAETIFLRKRDLIPVPLTVDPAEAIPLILNYLVAYQVLHRTAGVNAGDRVLVIGASGGIGTALLELGRLAGLKIYGLASGSKRQALIDLGAIPIDYHSQDFVEVIQAAEPQGLDVVFNGMAGDYLGRGWPLLRRGGVWVGYGAPRDKAEMVALIARHLWFTLRPDGRSARLYGTGMNRFNRQPFLQDWATLFALLEQGKIRPIIAARYPILEAAAANTLLESGEVVGTIVLLAPELLHDHNRHDDFPA